MYRQAREVFNASFSQEKYEALLASIHKQYPDQLDFRVAESPVFISRELKTKLLIASNEIIDAILKPSFKELTDAAIPEKFRFPNESENPEFLAIDFALTNNKAGILNPKLIELQGFPSLFAYQAFLSSLYKRFFDIPKNVSPFFNRMNAFGYQEKMKSFLQPKEGKTILLEVYPKKQKTRIDFILTKEFWEIDTVCLTDLIIENSKAYYLKNGEKLLINCIYNRIIWDDIERNYPELLPVIENLKKLEVEWLAHPNWFYRVSKFCMPLLKSEYVPKSFFLNKVDLDTVNLQDYVLKPLFSFAGSGVKIDVLKEDIESIPV